MRPERVAHRGKEVDAPGIPPQQGAVEQLVQPVARWIGDGVAGVGRGDERLERAEQEGVQAVEGTLDGGPDADSAGERAKVGGRGKGEIRAQLE